MAQMLLKIWDKMGRTWCGLMHDRITWPVNGRYRCRSCWREYAVAWEDPSAIRTARIPDHFEGKSKAQAEAWLSPAPSPSGAGAGL